VPEILTEFETLSLLDFRPPPTVEITVILYGATATMQFQVCHTKPVSLQVSIISSAMYTYVKIKVYLSCGMKLFSFVGLRATTTRNCLRAIK